MTVEMTKPRAGLPDAIANVQPDDVPIWESKGWNKRYPPADWPKGKTWPPKPKLKKKDAE